MQLQTIMADSHLKETVLAAEQRELEEFVAENKRIIKGRKLISEFLLFIGCQTLSASLAILLFQYTFKLWVLSLLCYAIGLSPSLPDLCEVNVNKTSEGGWNITFMQRPLKTIFKLFIGAGITYVGIGETRQAVDTTYQSIQTVYGEIHTYERPKTSDFQLPVDPMMMIAAISIVGLVAIIKEKL